VAYACPELSDAAEAAPNEIIAAVSGAVQESPHIITVQDLQPDLWTIKIDPRYLHLIVANLYLNAREAIVNQGRIKIITRNLEKKSIDQAYLRHLDCGRYVRLTVQDTGCGIPPEALEHIFEPFYSSKFMGRGMGLAAVQGIVKSCCGHIEVTSAPYCTRFNVYLPAVKKT
jgi:signal transduction histidine kinase